MTGAENGQQKIKVCLCRELRLLAARHVGGDMTCDMLKSQASQQADLSTMRQAASECNFL